MKSRQNSGAQALLCLAATADTIAAITVRLVAFTTRSKHARTTVAVIDTGQFALESVVPRGLAKKAAATAALVAVAVTALAHNAARKISEFVLLALAITGAQASARN